MKIGKTLASGKLNNLIILFSAGLLFWLSLTCLLPVLPTYIEDVGATTQQVGLVMGSFAIGLLLVRVPLGKLADRGGRKIVVLIGTFVAAVAPVGYLLVHSIAPLMVLRAFHGVSIAAFTTGYSALIVDLSPPKQRGEVIGYMSLVIPIGMALGPSLGGFTVMATNYTTLFLIAAGCGIISLLLATQVQEASNFSGQQLQTRENIPQRSMGDFFNSRSLRVPSLVMLLIGIVFGTLISFLPLFLRQSEVDLNAGLFYTAAAIASFAARALVGKASDYYGRGLFITNSLILYIFSMLLLFSNHSPTAFIIAAVLEGAGAGILLPMMIALMSDRSHAYERGRVYAFCIGGFDLGIALAGPLLGTLSIYLNYRSMYLIAAALALQALIVFLTLSSKDIAHSLRFATGQAKDIYALAFASKH